MSHTRFLNGDHIQQTKSGVAINGPRPTPLKLKQESHTIHKHHQQQPQMTRKPIIIYMRSPKVIHTKPHDFMALVQKLTGKSGSKHQEQQKKNKTLEEGYGVSHEMFNKPLNPLPNSSDYFFSPSSFLKLSDVVSSSPNKTTNSLSPGSIVEFMKRLPEY